MVDILNILRAEWKIAALIDKRAIAERIFQPMKWYYNWMNNFNEFCNRLMDATINEYFFGISSFISYLYQLFSDIYLEL